MKFKWTIPGLLSKYSFQSATFYDVEVVSKKTSLGGFTVEMMCTVPTFLMVYKTTDLRMCGTNPSNSNDATLVAVADAHGNLRSIQQLHEFTPASSSNSTAYSGSATGLAISYLHDVFWVCGQDDFESDESANVSDSTTCSHSHGPSHSPLSG